MFQNVHTGEKISWRPRHPAAREVGASRDITGRVGADTPGDGGLAAAEANAGPAAEHNAAALSQRSQRRAFAQELVRQKETRLQQEFFMWQQAWLARESRQGATGLMSDQLRQQKAREQSELAERIEKVQREKSWLADDNTAFTSAGDQLMRQLEMEHLGDMLDEARDEVVRMTDHIKGDMRARMFAEAMTKHALHMVYENEDLVDECLAHVHMIDPSWLTSFIKSLPSAVNARGTMAEPVDLENSEDEDEQPREAPAEEDAPGSCSDGDQEDDNAAQSGDNHEDKEIAEESVNVARKLPPWLDHLMAATRRRTQSF